MLQPRPSSQWRKAALLILLSCSSFATASLGDRLPEFRECVEVCKETNCAIGDVAVPISLRMMLWTCPQNCDYTCQHIVTDQRTARDPPMLEPVVQFHGKWPFWRHLGMQEPASVAFSLMNLFAHYWGQGQVKKHIPNDWALKRYYVLFGHFGYASWVFSAIFHTRDFSVTEKLDYFAAGASVLYGLYYTPIRVFRMDVETETRQSLLRLWTMLCAALYAAHVLYLSLWSWDYTYNMAANVVVGVISNLMWTAFSIKSYSASQKSWKAWPGLIVAWVVLAMSLELLDFPPWMRWVDAHSLWHLGTVGPTVWWYNFLVKDARAELAAVRLKA